MLFLIGPRPEITPSHDAPVIKQSCGRKRWWPLLLLLLFTYPAAADVALTMGEAEALALAAEPGQLSLSARAAAMEAQAEQDGYLPEPKLRMGLNNYPIQYGDFSTEGMTNATLAIRQVFPSGRSRALKSEQSRSLALSFSRNADARGRDVRALTQQAWLEAYYWQSARALVEDSRPYFSDLVEVSRSLYAVGRKSQQDVLRAELELSLLEDRLLEIDRQSEYSRATLAEWIGDAAQRPVADRLPAWDEIPEHAELKAAVETHPLLDAAAAEVAASQSAVDLAEARSRPDWELDLAYSYREGTLSTGEPRSDFISVNVSVGLPFVKRRSLDAGLTAALQMRTAARSSRDRIRRELSSELSAQTAHWEALSRRLALYEKQVLDQARGIAEASLLAYQNDRGDFADVMRAYIDDLNTRTEHLELKVERAKAYSMLANLGGLNP